MAKDNQALNEEDDEYDQDDFYTNEPDKSAYANDHVDLISNSRAGVKIQSETSNEALTIKTYQKVSVVNKAPRSNKLKIDFPPSISKSRAKTPHASTEQKDPIQESEKLLRSIDIFLNVKNQSL